MHNRLTALARLVPADGPTDAELLAAFVAARDDAAFAELVRRHGPAVLAVCRRVTTRSHDAEDAFQAAFLVLARKAHRVRAGAPLAAWLYGVALRAARKAAARAFRRHDRETLVADLPDVPDRAAEPFDPDAARAVVEEVDRLSAKYRAAVVLCELEGRSRAAAARELGIAEGTLSSRLAAARKVLAARLTARGVAPAALAALAADPVPPRLVAAASALAVGPAPAAVTSLAHGVSRAMTLKPLRAAGLALALVAAAAAAGLSRQPSAAPAPQPAAQPAPAPAPAAGGERLLVWCGGSPVILRPDGTVTHRLPGTGFEDASGIARFHPDGKRFAYSAVEQPRPRIEPARHEVYVRDLDAPGLGRRVPVDGTGVAWSGDGTELYGHFTDPRKDTAWDWTEEHGVAEFSFPKGHALIDRSPDGRHLLALDVDEGKDRPAGLEARLLRADRSGVAVVSNPRQRVTAGRFSPDGKAILLGVLPQPEANDPDRPMIHRVSMKDLAVSDVVRLPKGARLESVCGSPDGTRVAYTWYVWPDNTPLSDIEYRLTVCDLRGENAKTIYTRKGTALGSVDWR